jgi:arylsulfatase
MYVTSTPLYFPKVFNIEMDPHEDLNLGGITVFMASPAYQEIMKYEESVKEHPNRPCANMTHFSGAAYD